MIKNCDAPNDEWPRFYVTVKGQARSHEEGMKNLSVLETENHAFSSVDVQPEEITARIEREKRQELLKKKLTLLESIKDTKENVTVVSFANKYKINFPFETKDEFEKFDGRLKTESSLRLDFISLLNFWYAPTITTINCLNEVFKAHNCGNPSDILQAVGVILSNAKDWEGNRKK
ncbi:hypothetical protein KQX54_009872 [Cotesia glomerata]|uniref:Uncharacterized protein n=1 Tax=Cotesia glomerata TaxID=32391 RepID=A0AAV7ITM7_COTGL|nr:hypothetical protein KQX54_009872 [Cotesia glomerata]